MAPKVRHLYVEDVEWLLAFGMSPEDIAARLTVSLEALARAMYREERYDLASPFNRVVMARRKAARREARRVAS